MGVVWSILALIIGVVVAYLIYDEYVVGKGDAEESDLEKDIQADLVSLEVEAGIIDAADVAPLRTSTGEFVHEAAAEPVAAASVAAAPVAAAPVAAAPVITEASDDVEAVAVETTSEDVAVVQAAVAEETMVAETATDEEEGVAEEPIVEESIVEERAAAVEIDVPDEAEPAETPQPDDLTKIKGIGQVYAQRLNEAGIYTFAQLIDTDVETLEKVTSAIPAANAHDWARQAALLS